MTICVCVRDPFAESKYHVFNYFDTNNLKKPQTYSLTLTKSVPISPVF